MEKFAGIIHVGFNYSRCVGPRYHKAGVRLRLATHDGYRFANGVRWPAEDLGKVVERGARDGLAEAGFDPDLGVEVVLLEVEWDAIHSSEHSFYVAARCAARACADALGRGSGGREGG